MKAFLLQPDSDYDKAKKLPVNSADLEQDLALPVLFDAMANGDKELREVVRRVVLTGELSINSLLHRQQVLQDVLRNRMVVRSLHILAREALDKEKRVFHGFFNKYPAAILHRSIEVMEIFVESLQQVKLIAENAGEEFASDGFRRLFAMLRAELSPEYLSRVKAVLKELAFDDGVWVSAGLGQGNKGTGYTLRKSNEVRQTWLQRLFSRKKPDYVIEIAERDENGARALGELRERGINEAANVLAQSADHILSFFENLQMELAFYIGCLNLQEALAAKGCSLCMPQVGEPTSDRYEFIGLYEVCLALQSARPIVANDTKIDAHNPIVITGANQGGKTTYLRSLGLAHLMMQAGMFVPAASFAAPLCYGLFTHFKREEDATMQSGKLDEELARMSELAERLRPHAMILFNESFAATNEREGSEISRQIVSALVERRVRVLFVTHQYDFAGGLFADKSGHALFLRADRQPDGSRSYKIAAGEPLPTSFGEDLYAQIFPLC